MQSTRKQRSLNGEWQLLLDREDHGRTEKWQEQAIPASAMTVTVPSVWDRWIPDYEGVGWYFHTFTICETWTAYHTRIHFEAVDYYAEVWLNGHFLGDHEGGYTPFTLDTGDALQPGENRLVVRVVDPHGTNGFGNFQPHEIPCAKENSYWSFAGIWGDVRLEGLPAAHIRDVFVCPDVRRKQALVHIDTAAPGTVHAQIEGTDYEVSGAPGRLKIEMPGFTPWAPEEPHLYTLHCTFTAEDGARDVVDIRFGMREFTVKDNRFFLNNRPYYVRAVLHQPDYPRSLAGPESAEMARSELEQAKAAGFNMVRCHIKTPPRITLDLADEIGLLIYEEPPIGWIQKSPRMEARCTREVREMILRDRNHPSVVVWGMLNETGNAHYATQGGAQTIKEKLCALARELDPTRLIIDDSGGVNATREPARYMRPYHDDLKPYDDLHIYQRAPVDRDMELYYQHSGTPDALYFLSGFGFGGPEDLADVLGHYGDEADTLKDARCIKRMLEAAQQGFAERDLTRAFTDFANFLKAARQLQVDAARFQIDAIRANVKGAGYCYTQLCDAGQGFCAGMLDRWRRPKPVFRVLQEVQRPLHPIIEAARTNLTPRDTVPITIRIANDHRIEDRVDLSLQVIGPTKQVLWKKRRAVKLPRHGRELWQGEVAASGSRGTHRFVVRLIHGGRVIAQNQIELHVFAPAKPSPVDVHLVDPLGRWHERVAQFCETGSETAPVHVIPPLANTIGGYPDQALTQVLAQVENGAVAVFFGPPDDWNRLAEVSHLLPKATSKGAVGCLLPAVHYVKLHPVFDGLPTRCLMRQAYRGIVPNKTFLEHSDEDICGTFDTSPIASGNHRLDATTLWGSDILVQRFGGGRLVFTHLRLLEHLGEDPVANQVFVNLLNHFARRSVPAEDTLSPDVRVAEWLRTERGARVRRWMVIGEFPNWNGTGHETAYAPESRIEFKTAYAGWYKAITWQPWYTKKDADHVLDFQDAFSPIFTYYARFDYATGYAYAEFTADRRMDATLRIGVQNDTKLWVNGRLVHESRQQIPHDRFGTQIAHAPLRQGRNTVLVKCAKIPGPFRFSLHIEDDKERPLPLTWWK
ncbi:MAG: sugar-binding domain-containing protein [Candidatus Hydrogenedentota bacterium]